MIKNISPLSILYLSAYSLFLFIYILSPDLKAEERSVDLSSSNLSSSEPKAFQFSEEMETDRPDFTEGTKTIESGHIQVEAGYTFTENNDDGVSSESHTIPELLLRVGLSEKSELRIGWQGYENSETESNGDKVKVDGLSDLILGTKFRLVEDPNAWDISSIIEMSLPVGNSDITSDKYEPGLKFLFAKDLTERFSFASNINAAYLSGSTERYYELSASASLATNLNESIGLYIEYFGFYPLEEVPESNLHYINGGFTYALTSNLQLDLRLGTGLNSEADDLFTGVGVAFRM